MKNNKISNWMKENTVAWGNLKIPPQARQEILLLLESYEAKKVRRFDLLLRDGFRCHYCGDSLHKSPNVKLVIDHIIPKALGGKDTTDNLITCCQLCNLQKGVKLLTDEIIEFLKK